MSNNFKTLLENYTSELEQCIGCESLEQLQDAYTNMESSREEILNWVFENVETEEEQSAYFSTFGETESSILDGTSGIPIFDESFDIYESFDEYEAYYQRYGCMSPEFVVSWDTENVLFDDGEGNIEIVARPDVLMGNAE
jgi:hypothetical protein